MGVRQGTSIQMSLLQSQCETEGKHGDACKTDAQELLSGFTKVQIQSESQ